MKLSSKSVLFLGMLSSTVFASEYSSPVENVEVHKTTLSTLSIQNLSKENIQIDIYGVTINLTPATGVQFECSGYDNLELQIKNIDHEYLKVPCKSRVVIAESFTNQYVQGQ